MSRLESLQKKSRCTNDSKLDFNDLGHDPLRLELKSRLEPLADNLIIIFMKKYDFERASCMHDIFKSRQF